MKRVFLSFVTTLALCLCLLPGTAFAAGDNTLYICGTEMETGFYTVNADGSGVTKADGSEAPNEPYLEYDSGSGTLTVHGSVALEYGGGRHRRHRRPRPGF